MSALLEQATSPPKPALSREAAALRFLETLEPGQGVRIQGMSWKDYLSFDHQLEAEHRSFRISYLEGAIEFMAPSFYHERISRRIERCALTLARRLRISYVTCSTTTFRREDREAGLQPDECFYFANWASVGHLKDIDLSIHPPPDLAVEVDRFHSNREKLSIYQRLGVPEIWRFDPNSVVTFLRLDSDGEYETVATSGAVPVLTSSELTRFLGSGDWRDESKFDDDVDDWAAALVPKKS